MAAAAYRRLYDAAVDVNAVGLPPEEEMAYRHACGLAWHHLDLDALIQDVAAGRMTFDALVEKMRPFVKEALRIASAGQAGPTALQ
jgi:hypothetical protein